MPEPRPGWGERIGHWIAEQLAAAWDWAAENTEFVRSRELVAKEMEPVINAEHPTTKLLDEMLDIEGLTEGVRVALTGLKTLSESTELPISELVGLTALKIAFDGYLAPFAVAGTHVQNRELRPSRPDPATAWGMWQRDHKIGPMVLQALRDQGWTEEWIVAWQKVVARTADLSELYNLAWRQNWTLSTWHQETDKLGYQREVSDQLWELKERIPGPGDLISMAVREAFHPELVAKYHYMDNFPPEFAEWMEKQGYSREWAEKYWTAHWVLPSITLGFEMMHRLDEVGEAEIRDLLRTADIAPVWHDPIIKVSYSPYTRVDVRRMHALGVITDDELIKAYTDLGYDTEHATNMARFTILYNMEEERTASRTDIINAYRDGAIGRDGAVDYLRSIGYSEMWANYYLDHEDLAAHRKVVAAETDLIGDQYVAGEIDRTTAITRLGELGLASKQVQLLLAEWDIKIRSKVARPTVSQLKRFFKDGLIDSRRYRTELEHRGYSPEYAGWYIANTLNEMQAEAVAEQERAAREAERIEAKEIKTAYEEGVARINYQIAQLRVEYANLRSIHEARLGAAQRRQLMDVIAASRTEIAALQREIAEKRTDLESVNARIRALDVTPEIMALIERRGDITLQIETARATIAEMRAALVAVRNAKARMELIGPAESLRAGIDETLVTIAEQQEIVANLRAQIAAVGETIAEQKVILARQRAELRDVGIDPELLSLFDRQAELTEDIAVLNATIAAMRVELAGVRQQITLEELADPAAQLQAERDALTLAIRENQERIAEARETIAIAEGELAAELTSEEIAALESRMRDIQTAIRTLEAERARLRIEL